MYGCHTTMNKKGSDNMIAKCNNCKFAKETNVCYDNGKFFATYLYCFKLDDLVTDDDSCDKWESDIKTVKETHE